MEESKECLERLAFQKSHDDECESVPTHSKFMNGHDSRMDEPAGDACLAQKPPCSLRPVRADRDHLDGHLTFQLGVPSCEDDSHASPA